MKAPLLIAALVLLMAEGLAIMNNACKSGHTWCAPISSIQHRVKTGHG